MNWEKQVSKFPIDFDETETVYIPEGEIQVTPECGVPVQILPSDLAVFPEGQNKHGEVARPLRKHYSYDSQRTDKKDVKFIRSILTVQVR